MYTQQNRVKKESRSFKLKLIHKNPLILFKGKEKMTEEKED